jgi:hypothetical protein
VYLRSFSLSLLGLAVSSILALAADAPKTKQQQQPQKKKTSAVAPAASGEAGMTVTRDPLTGKFEQGAVDARPQLLRLQLGTPEPQTVTGRNGMVAVRTTSEHMSASFVTRNADGTLQMQCVEGVDKAEAVIKQAAEKGEK